jgi:hypothetical protein
MWHALLAKAQGFWDFVITSNDLKVLIQEKAKFCLVGDDDSGPEDA